ncbi:MAG: hypothetical protein ACXVCR_04850 [Bdellovibrio sp.]
MNCINNKSGTKNTKNLRINDSFEKLLQSDTKDPLIADYQNYLKSLEQKKETAPEPQKPQCYLMSCAENFPVIKTLSARVEKIFKSANRTRKIKKECIEASLQREVNNDGFFCDGIPKKPSKFDNKIDPPCLKENIVDFIHYSVNQALNCFSSQREAIDSRFILKKINNESGFNFFLGYSGGTGLGALTSHPIKDTWGYFDENKNFVKGRVKKVLEEILESPYPSCKPFIEIIKKDMAKNPPYPTDNYCTWIKPGEGLGRNLIYSLAYYVFVRDEVIKPELNEKYKKISTDKEIINYLTLMSYGPGGTVGAMTELTVNRADRLGISKEKLINSSEYLTDTEKKSEEMIEILKKDNPEIIKKFNSKKPAGGAHPCLDSE